MKKITIKKVKPNHVKALQGGINSYIAKLSTEVSDQMSLLYFDNVLQLDILHKLYLMMRNKIESDSSTYSVILRPSEAVVLLYACTYMQKPKIGEPLEHAVFDSNVAEMFKNEIDRQLKSL